MKKQEYNQKIYVAAMLERPVAIMLNAVTKSEKKTKSQMVVELLELWRKQHANT